MSIPKTNGFLQESNPPISEVHTVPDDLNESIEVLDNSDSLKIVEENGSCGSPDIEEIVSDDQRTTNSDSMSNKDSTPKKKRAKLDPNTPPRRSTRIVKRAASYAEKEDEEEGGIITRVIDGDDGSDIEEIKPEDPLAVDNKDKENSKFKYLKNNKTTIVVNDTKRLVEIAAGSKCSMKGGKKVKKNHSSFQLTKEM